METVSVVVTCVAALVAGHYAGSQWARDAIWATALGAVAGELCAAVFWALALFVATMVPAAAVNGRAVGVDFEILVIVTPVCGAIAGVMGYRRTLPPR